MTNETDLAKKAQIVRDVFRLTAGTGTALAEALRVAVDLVVPEESEAPKAEFDCEPNMKGRDGTLRHNHSAYMRRQFAQEELDFYWKQRQETRAAFLSLVSELATKLENADFG